jgi:hypothetical protein
MNRTTADVSPRCDSPRSILRGTDWQSVLLGNVCNVWVNSRPTRFGPTANRRRREPTQSVRGDAFSTGYVQLDLHNERPWTNRCVRLMPTDWRNCWTCWREMFWYDVRIVRVSGTALAAGIPVSSAIPEPVASAIPLTCCSNDTECSASDVFEVAHGPQLYNANGS